MPEPMEPLWELCPQCMEYYSSNPMLTHAFASVGIEHGMSTYQMAMEYFLGYHNRGHKEL